MTNNPKILFLVTEDWYFLSHRLPIAREARAQGYDVVVLTRVNQHGKLIEAEKFKLIPIRMSRRGKNPIHEFLTLRELIRLYRSEQPTIVHHVAMKPILYGSVAAWMTGVRVVVNAFTGMGYLFISTSWKAKLLRPFVEKAFRFLLNRSNCRTILQNPDDRTLLLDSGIVQPDRISIIRGSGVDIRVFRPSPEPPGIPAVVLASRMLWDKGVGEFVDAARCLRDAGLSARFILTGDSDPENPAAVPTSQLERWHGSGVVEWRRHRVDMPEAIAQAHIVCLPSYREGLPKVLIEAAASGRPVVATNVPGCREIVKDGVNGLLVPVRDSGSLAKAIRILINDPVARKEMGMRGRQLVEREFSNERVVSETLALYREMLA